MPGTHCMHREAPELGETEPASHKAQLLWPATAAYLPGEHVPHVPVPASPLYLPVGHESHTVAPILPSEWVPIGQSEQSSDPAEAAYVPMSH